MDRSFSDDKSTAATTFQIVQSRMLAFTVRLVQIFDIRFLLEFSETVLCLSEVIVALPRFGRWSGLDRERQRHCLPGLLFDLFEHALSVDVEKDMIANPSTSDHANIEIWKVLGVLCDLGDFRRGIDILIPQDAALLMWMNGYDLQLT